MNKKILALAVCVLAMPIFATAESVYKWTDENGVIHFGDRKPTGMQSESVSIRTGKNSVSTTASPQQKVEQMDQERAESRKNEKMNATEQARQKQRAANCETAENNLALIGTGSRITVQDNGEERYLTPEEISEKREQFEKIAELNCGDNSST